MRIIDIFSRKKLYQLVDFHGTEAEVDKWIVSDFITGKLIPIIGTRPYPVSELEMLVAVMIWYRPTHVCDWGTHVGKATRIFYETARSFGLKSQIISVDLPEEVEHIEHPHNERGRFVKGKTTIKLLLGDGALTSLKYLRRYRSTKIRPLFFLDGDHSYRSVKRELKLVSSAYPKAVIIIHDTFYQSKESGYNIGPNKAVTEYLQKHPHYEMINTNFGLPGMTALLPRNEK